MIIIKLILPLLLCLALSRTASALDEDAVKSTIAHLMESDRRQHRPEMIIDPVLMKVAERRAQDMANRDYFNHVDPDGHGPNYLLAQAGYPLPQSWLQSASANNVESICAGWSTPELAWQSWMRSKPHRTHLLALQHFYAQETRYGIGFAYNPATLYKYYYVVITAPPRDAPQQTAQVVHRTVVWMDW